MIFFIGKTLNFLFLHCAYGPTCEKSWFLGHIYFAKRFFIFSSEKLDVVTITRYQITFWIFDFSLLDIWTQKSCNACCTPCMICQKIRTDADGRTDAYGHRFLNVCHTRAPKGAINSIFWFKSMKDTSQNEISTFKNLHLLISGHWLYRYGWHFLTGNKRWLSWSG